jgi:hypothetical protein
MNARLFCPLLATVLFACAPVRRGDDDDDDVTDDDATDGIEAIWAATDPGVCDVIPDNEYLLPEGGGVATVGLFYAVTCWWNGGNASSVDIQIDAFDEVSGGDYAVSGVTARDLSGIVIPLSGDFGELHVEPGSGTFNGWWQGDLVGTSSKGPAIELQAVVFRDAAIEAVMGR